jgi:hypothetical protein
VSNSSITLRDLRKSPLKLATDAKHTITISRFAGQILEMEDLTFHLDSAVMMPDPAYDEDPATDPQDRITGLAVLRACYAYAADNADEKIVIAGHADASGSSAAYNFTLSGLRADNVRCALKGDRGGWVKIAKGKHIVDDYQQILLWASYTFGWDCDPGTIDGVAGDKTAAAVRGFQKRYNHEFPSSIAVDGTVGPQTWGAFFDLYMRELAELMDTDADGLASARDSLVFVDDGHKTVGCGASHPVDQVTAIAVRPAPGAPARRSVVRPARRGGSGESSPGWPGPHEVQQGPLRRGRNHQDLDQTKAGCRPQGDAGAARAPRGRLHRLDRDLGPYESDAQHAVEGPSHAPVARDRGAVRDVGRRRRGTGHA